MSLFLEKHFEKSGCFFVTLSLYLTKVPHYAKVPSMNWKTPENKKLLEAVLSLRTPAEAKRFLRDLMTEVEIAEFANRLSAASMLSLKIPYSRIQKETGLSTTTIARVSKWLKGKEGGYRLILNRTHHSATISRERGLR